MGFSALRACAFRTSALHLFLVLMQPTRLKSKTLIDNILLNSLEYSSYSGNLLYELSDHLIQFLLLEGFAKERSFVETKMYKRDFDNFNEREFEEEVINGVDWDEICMFRLNEASLSFENNYFIFSI